MGQDSTDSKRCYQIVTGNTPEILAKAVNEEMAKGWLPQGGIIATQIPATYMGKVWAQAMIRPPEGDLHYDHDQD
jgi:hypothetical protein